MIAIMTSRAKDVPCNIREHVSRFFPHRQMDVLRWKRTPLKELLPDFQILRVGPSEDEKSWLFFSDGAAHVKTKHEDRYEFFVISPEDDPIHLETLSMIVTFMTDPRYSLYPGKIVDIGRPWMPGSNLDHLLVSLPYPFGPQLEKCGNGPLGVRILWLQPIASSEATYAEQHGLEELEREFETKKINYMASKRSPVV